jgi:3-phenylpropionate/cinnamic acid dioxygenase small subunit
MNRVLSAMGTAALSCLLPASLAWAATPAGGLSGEWQFNSKAGQTPIVVDCQIRQTGTTLAGSCEPRSDGSTQTPFTGGSVSGAKARWAYSVVFRGNTNTVEFDTEVKSATRMTGTLKLNAKPSDLTGEKLGMEARLQRLEDESEIRRRLQDYMVLLHNRDWDRYVLMFSRDADIVMDEGTRHGRDDIRNRMSAAGDRMAKAAAGKPVRQSADLLSNVEIRVRGDIADVSSRFTFLAENEANQFVVRGSGLYLDSWVREDGEWLIKRRKVAWDLLAGATPAPPSGGK